MVKKRRLIPIWYIIFVAVLYWLPLIAFVLGIFITNLEHGLMSALAVIPGASFVGAMIFYPYFCIYYAVVTLLHAIIDETLIFKKTPWWSRLAMVGVTLITSVMLGLGGASRFYYPNIFDIVEWSDFPWLTLILVFLGVSMSAWSLEIRIAFGIVYTKLAHKRARRSQPATEYEPIDIDLREM